MKNWLNNHKQFSGFTQVFFRTPKRTLVDSIFDDWFLYCFSLDAEKSEKSINAKPH